MTSHPLGYAKHFSAVNEDSGNKIRPTVKLFKYWRDRNLRLKNRRPKSYLLEVLVSQQMSKLDFTGKGQAEVFSESLHTIYSYCEAAYLDPEERRTPRVMDPMLNFCISKMGPGQFRELHASPR